MEKGKGKMERAGEYFFKFPTTDYKAGYQASVKLKNKTVKITKDE